MINLFVKLSFTSSFADVLDAAGNLRVDEQEELVELLQKRTIEERRHELVKDIKNARSDFTNRKYSKGKVDILLETIGTHEEVY